MQSGYKILWTNHALAELEKTIEYLKINFSEKELKRLAHKIEGITELISQNPNLFPHSDKEGVY
ncbi:MAG: type II toxin-antitoxin system RelE/ParE family toxin [Chitinophagaceae bacterium]